jgi:glycosyltransferase involved in cell wall biosynthesis
MKILYHSYPTAFQYPGGGEVQILKTREYVIKSKNTVDLFNPYEHKIRDYPIIHQFSMRPEGYELCKLAKELGKKVYLSSIYWEDRQYDKSKYPLMSYFKYLAIFLDRHFHTSIYSPGKILRLADYVLPNSLAEAKLLNKSFGIPFNRIVVIPNAVDTSFAKFDRNLFKKKYGLTDYVLCVGRIEPRKNQLSLIKAIIKTDLKLVLMGEKVKGMEEYYDECKRISNKNVHFIGNLPHGSEIQKSAYANAKIFALTSWYETPGLAALEAALTGTRIVITERGCTKEYFKDFAEYVDPSSVKDIYDKIQISLSKKHDPKKQIRYILKNFTWKATAKKTIEAYKKR